MLLLFIEKYADLAVPLDANIKGTDVDDDAAIQALMEGTTQETATATATSAPSGRPKSASPKSKGKKKVDDHVICGIPESAGQNLVPDVVLELEESEMANKRGHVVIAIENPNPDLDIKILVRVRGLEFAAVDFTVNLCCFLVSSDMTNRVDGNTSYPPSQMKDYVYCDQAKQTFNQMCFFCL